MNWKKFLIGISLVFFFSACETTEDFYEPNTANLEVYVYGCLSLNAREDVTVSLYLTRQDAENDVNRVTGKFWTDGFGRVRFYGLIPQRTYFVRAKPVIGRTIRETNIIYLGNNYFELCII